MPPGVEHEEIKRLLQENIELARENQVYLRKLHRYALIGFWAKVVGYILLIGLPFALYFYVLEPYFEAFGASYQVFIDGLNELPGLKGIDQLFNGERQ